MNDFNIQIVSKYLYNFKDIENLLKINKTLKDLYHTTFELIYIPCNYVLPKHQIIKIVNKIIDTFPNLEEIILNFTTPYNYLCEEYFDNILHNYLNFLNIIENKNKNINIKIKFDCRLKINLDINNYSKFNIWLQLISKISYFPIYIYIITIHINDIELYKFCKKYKEINFIRPIYTPEFINEGIKINNFFYSYYDHMFGKTRAEFDNDVYVNNYLKHNKLINVLKKYLLFSIVL